MLGAEGGGRKEEEWAKERGRESCVELENKGRSLGALESLSVAAPASHPPLFSVHNAHPHNSRPQVAAWRPKMEEG